MRRLRPPLWAGPWGWLGFSVSFATHAGEPSVPVSALKACAAIDAPAPRLACFDELTERPTPPAEPRAPAHQPPQAAATPKQSFGLYGAEHPAPPRTSLKAKVLQIRTGANGKPSVALEGGQWWELDGLDPLLAVGDEVTITRAALGSFLMSTAQGRPHRVRRVR